MSIIEKTKCDSCGHLTLDYYAEIGWIHFKVGFQTATRITITKGRKADGQADTIYHKVSGDIDFCSLQCFCRWVQEEGK